MRKDLFVIFSEKESLHFFLIWNRRLVHSLSETISVIQSDTTDIGNIQMGICKYRRFVKLRLDAEKHGLPICSLKGYFIYSFANKLNRAFGNNIR